MRPAARADCLGHPGDGVRSSEGNVRAQRRGKCLVRPQLPAPGVGRESYRRVGPERRVEQPANEPAHVRPDDRVVVRAGEGRRRVAEIADQQLFRAFQQAVARRRLVDVEREVAATLGHQEGRVHLREQRPARARRGERAEGREVLARDRVLLDRLHRRVEALGRNGVEQLVDRAGLGQVLRRERAVEVGPGLHRLDCGPRHAFDQGAQHRAAAERHAPGADRRMVDARQRRDKGVDLAHVLDLARPVDGDEALRLAVAAHVDREDDEARGEAARDRVQVASLAAEAVEHDDRGMRARRVGRVERRRDIHVVGLILRGAASCLENADARPAPTSASNPAQRTTTTRRPT